MSTDMPAGSATNNPMFEPPSEPSNPLNDAGSNRPQSAAEIPLPAPSPQRLIFEVNPEGVYVNGAYVPAVALDLKMCAGGLCEVNLTLELVNEVTAVESDAADVYFVITRGWDDGTHRSRKFRVVEVIDDGKDAPQLDLGIGMGGVPPAAPVAGGCAAEPARSEPEVPAP